MAKFRYESERDIEKLFTQEIRDKKKAGSGSFHKRGKGMRNGIKGVMKTQRDMLKGKAKKEYEKPGELIVFNLKDIISREEFFKKSEAEQKQLLQVWRENYQNDVICSKSGIKKGEYYDLVKKYGLKSHKGGNMGVNKRSYPPEKIEEFRNNVIDFETFLTLVIS